MATTESESTQPPTIHADTYTREIRTALPQGWELQSLHLHKRDTPQARLRRVCGVPATVSYRHFRSYVVIVPVGAIVLLILLAPLVLAMAFALQRIMDRRRLGHNRNPNDVSAGRFVTCIPVELVVEHEAAMHIAETAIAKSGGTEIERWDDSTVTGWTKMPFPGFGWAPRNLGSRNNHRGTGSLPLTALQPTPPGDGAVGTSAGENRWPSNVRRGTA